MFVGGNQRKFCSMINSAIKNALFGILVYDITDTDSFRELNFWIENTKKLYNDIIWILLGNKSDLNQERKISTSEGKEFAENHNMQFYEVSAKTENENIFNEIFMIPINKIIKKFEQGFYDLKYDSELKYYFLSRKNINLDNTTNINILQQEKQNIKNEKKVENDENDGLLKRIDELKLELMQEKSKNEGLNKKIIEFEQIIKEKEKKEIEFQNIIKDMEKIIKELNIKIKDLNKYKNKLNDFISDKTKLIKFYENEIKDSKYRYPIELLPGEKMLSILLISYNEDIVYSIICKNTDKFSNIEEIFYKEFPEYRKMKVNFIINGNRIINKNKNLDDNIIKHNSIIIIQAI